MKVNIMSRSTHAIANKHQKHSKVHFRQYLYDSGEPDDYMGHDTNSDDKVQFLEPPNRYYMDMRRKIRRDALQLRMRYS